MEIPVSEKQPIRELKKNGFGIERIRGSHYIMKNGSIRVTVPNHTCGLPKGTEAAIRKQVGLT